MPIKLTPEGMRAIFPRAPQAVIDAFVTNQGALAAAGILNTQTRLLYALSNVEHECAGFTIPNLTENIRYTHDRMHKVWPSRFASANDVRQKYGAGPGWQMLAFDDIYGNRMGNRPGTRDGSKYIGRGGPQITGRDGYAEVGRRCGLDLVNNPELASAPEHQPAILAAFWSWKNLNRFADAKDFKGCVKVWNGGTNGMADRLAQMAGNDPIIKRMEGLEIAAPVIRNDRPSPSVTSTGDPQVAGVQRRLDAMGYPPGVVDGKWGGMTAGAIAGFKNDRGLTGDPVIDIALLNELTKAEAEGFRRPIAKARAEANTETVAKSAPEIIPVQQSKRVGILATITSLALAAINAVADYFQDAMAWVGALKSSASDMPAYVWFIVAALVTAAMAYAARNGAKGIIEAFRKGERT